MFVPLRHVLARGTAPPPLLSQCPPCFTETLQSPQKIKGAVKTNQVETPEMELPVFSAFYFLYYRPFSPTALLVLCKALHRSSKKNYCLQHFEASSL